MDGRHDVKDLQSRDFAIIVRGGVKKSGYDEKLASKYQMTRPLIFKNDERYERECFSRIPYNIRDYGDPNMIKRYMFNNLKSRDAQELFMDIDLS